MKIDWRRFLVEGINWKRILGFLLFLYGLVFALSVFFSERLIFPYSVSSYDDSLPGLEMIRALDGTEIATRMWPAQKEAFLVLYFHGNAEDLGHLDFIAGVLNRRGLSVLAIDYRGYGLSGGVASEHNAYSDARLFYDHALGLGYVPEQIVLWGRSVGSGSAVDLAFKVEARALVLESPFITAFRVLTEVPVFPFDRFNNLGKIPSVDEALFIIHGKEDRIIPSWHGEALFREHRGRKALHLVPRAGHNDLWMYDLEKVLASFDQFIQVEPEQVVIDKID